MECMARISLKEQLQKVVISSSNFLNVFEIYLEDYFKGLSRITGTPYFENSYHNELHGIVEHNNTNVFLVSVPQTINDLAADEQTETLFKILIEPFAYMENQLKMEVKTIESNYKETQSY